jgi:hypothetical protein
MPFDAATAADLFGHLVAVEQRIAAGEVTDPKAIALARRLRAALDAWVIGSQVDARLGKDWKCPTTT